MTESAWTGNRRVGRHPQVDSEVPDRGLLTLNDISQLSEDTVQRFQRIDVYRHHRDADIEPVTSVPGEAVCETWYVRVVIGIPRDNL